MNKILLCCCAFCVLCAGCSGTISKQYLMLYFDPSIRAGADSAKSAPEYPFVIQVKKLSLAPLYDNAKAVVRTGDFAVKYADRALWAVRPDITATDLLLQTMKANFKFKSVKGSDLDESPDYIITGDILVIEEDQRKEERRASLGMVLRASKSTSGAVVLEKKYQKYAFVNDEGYEALVAQFSFLLDDVYKSFASELIPVFNRESEARNDKNKSENY